ncbi:hypothetical protein [Streptomyces cinereoruber]|uniref:hypothetical protein n=1 Tax=Streptomyces cinereoruber TaxID=67260 RepID=UPI00366A0E5B
MQWHEGLNATVAKVLETNESSIWTESDIWHLFGKWLRHYKQAEVADFLEGILRCWEDSYPGNLVELIYEYAATSHEVSAILPMAAARIADEELSSAVEVGDKELVELILVAKDASREWIKEIVEVAAFQWWPYFIQECHDVLISTESGKNILREKGAESFRSDTSSYIGKIDNARQHFRTTGESFREALYRDLSERDRERLDGYPYWGDLEVSDTESKEAASYLAEKKGLDPMLEVPLPRKPSQQEILRIMREKVRMIEVCRIVLGQPGRYPYVNATNFDELVEMLPASIRDGVERAAAAAEVAMASSLAMGNFERYPRNHNKIFWEVGSERRGKGQCTAGGCDIIAECSLPDSVFEKAEISSIRSTISISIVPLGLDGVNERAGDRIREEANKAPMHFKVKFARAADLVIINPNSWERGLCDVVDLFENLKGEGKAEEGIIYFTKRFTRWKLRDLSGNTFGRDLQEIARILGLR